MHIIIKNDHKNHIRNGKFEYCVDHKCKKLIKLIHGGHQVINNEKGRLKKI